MDSSQGQNQRGRNRLQGQRQHQQKHEKQEGEEKPDKLDKQEKPGKQDKPEIQHRSHQSQHQQQGRRDHEMPSKKAIRTQNCPIELDLLDEIKQEARRRKQHFPMVLNQILREAINQQLHTKGSEARPPQPQRPQDQHQSKRETRDDRENRGSRESREPREYQRNRGAQREARPDDSRKHHTHSSSPRSSPSSAPSKTSPAEETPHTPPPSSIEQQNQPEGIFNRLIKILNNNSKKK